MYLALYRKYRPQNFTEVVEQKHIVQTLINQIESDKIGHAYLFTGSRGTGKTSIAKIFARAINCEHPVNGDACEKCQTCKALGENNNIDILEIDAASNNGVDEIRDLREKVKYPPVNGKYKVYIIDEVHMLSPSAFNALLKTLEEPPKHVVFILATTEVHKLPATILSRCMRFDFKLVSVEGLVGLLKKVLTNEKVEFDEQALNLIARAGEGSVRDTLSIADMCISYSGNKLTHESVVEVLGTTEKEKITKIAGAILSGNLGDSLLELDKMLSAGKNPLVLSRDLISYFRDLLIIYTLKDNAKNMVVVPTPVLETMKTQATEENYSRIIETIEELSCVEADLRYSVQPRIVLETVIIKIISDAALIERVECLEKFVKQGTLPVQNNKIAENVYKQTETTPNLGQKTQNLAETDHGVDKNEAFGNLVSFLRAQKHMSLLAIIRSVKEIKYEGKTAIIFVDDQETFGMLNSEKYAKILKDYFSSIGLDYIVKIASKVEPEKDIDKLKSMFGSKLEIKE